MGVVQARALEKGGMEVGKGSLGPLLYALVRFGVAAG